MEKTFTKEEVEQNNTQLTIGWLIIGGLVFVSNKLGQRKGRKTVERELKMFVAGSNAEKSSDDK